MSIMSIHADIYLHTRHVSRSQRVHERAFAGMHTTRYDTGVDVGVVCVCGGVYM